MIHTGAASAAPNPHHTTMTYTEILTADDLAFLKTRHVDCDFLADILENSGADFLRDFVREERQYAAEEAELDAAHVKAAANEDAYYAFIDAYVGDLCSLYESKGWSVVRVHGRLDDSRYISVERDERVMVVRVSDHDQPKGGSWRRSSTGAEGRDEADVCFKVPTFDAFCTGAREITRTK